MMLSLKGSVFCSSLHPKVDSFILSLSFPMLDKDAGSSKMDALRVRGVRVLTCQKKTRNTCSFIITRSPMFLSSYSIILLVYWSRYCNLLDWRSHRTLWPSPHYAREIWKRRFHSDKVSYICFPSVLLRRNLKTTFSFWQSIIYMFSFRITPEKFENATLIGNLDLCLRKTRARESHDYRILIVVLKSSVLKCFLSRLRS